MDNSAKQNITEYSDNELSLLVFNDEHLYKSRKHHRFLGLIDLLFVYRPEQLEVLKQDLEDDANENV